MEEIDYSVMRYDIDSNGYILNIYFGCASGTCSGYKGDVPSGYSDLEEWSMEANIRAYKIVDGNLVYDENRDNELQAQFEKEEEENSLATHCWVNEKLSKISNVVMDELLNNIEGSSLLLLNNSADYEIPKIVLSSDTTIDEVKIISSNKNILKNSAVTTTLNGVTFTVNEDGSITLNGTSTSSIEFTLDGTNTNTEMLFLLKQSTNYVVSGLASNITLNLYNYNGTDRTSLYSGINGIINLSNSNEIVTHSILTIPSGKTFSNVTIYPQIEVSDVPSDYVKHSSTKLNLTLYENPSTIYEGLNSYDPTTVIMIDKVMNINVDYYENISFSEKYTSIDVYEEGIEMVTSSIDDNEERITQLETTTDGLNITITNNQKTLNSSLESLDNQVKDLNEATNDLTNDLNTLSGTITQMNFSFQTDGLKIGKEGSEINSTLDNVGLKIYNYDTLNSIFNKNGSGMNKVIAIESIQLQNLLLKPRFHNGRQVISGFWLEELIGTLEDLEVE